VVDRYVPDLGDDQELRLGEELQTLLKPIFAEGLAERRDEPGRRREEGPDALRARREAEGDGQVRLPDARGPEEQDIFCALDVAAGGELADHLGVDRGLEFEVEALEGLVEGKAGHGRAHREVFL